MEHSTLEQLWEKFAPETAAVVSAMFIFGLSVLASVVSQAMSNKTPKRPGKSANDDLNHQSRLEDLRAVYRSNRAIYLWSSIASFSLTFGQVIIGGLLTSSFIQSSLDGTQVGVMGVLVLVSSLINQTYRPDIYASQSKHRMYKSIRLIRMIEDGIFEIEHNEKSILTIHEIRKIASEGLADLEEFDLATEKGIALRELTVKSGKPVVDEIN